jgi:hypothetical protein
MNLPATQEAEILTERSLPPLVDVGNVSKLYHLWESPHARLIYGLWSSSTVGAGAAGSRSVKRRIRWRRP